MSRLSDFDTPGLPRPSVPPRPVARYGAEAEWSGPASLGPNTARQADTLHEGWGPVHVDEAEHRFTQWQLEEEEHLDTIASTLVPEEIEGFAERVIGDYFERAKGFKQTLPETVRPVIDKKLAGHEQNLFARAATIETRERTRAAREGLDGSLRDTLLPAVVSAAQLSPDDPDKPARLAGAEIQAVRLIDGNPSLRPHEKAARKAAASAMIHTAFAEALPEAEKRDLDAGATIETLGGRIRRLTQETTPNDTADGLDDFDEPDDFNEAEAAPSNVDGFGREAWLELIRRHRPELAAGRHNAALLALRADAELSADLRERGFAESGRYLAANGHAPSPANLYLAHSSSPEGAAALLDADPEALAAEIDPVAARDRPELFFEDGDPERPRTAGETIALADERMAGARVADWRQRLGGASPDLLQALARDAGEATARQAAEARLAEDAAYRSQLEETIAAIDDGGFGLAALHKASGTDGWLRDAADIDRLRERITARSAETGAYRDAADRYADPQEQFDPASPDDQGAVDLIYRLGPAKDGAGLAEGDATAQRVLDQIIDRTGIVPAKARNFASVSGSLNNGKNIVVENNKAIYSRNNQMAPNVAQLDESIAPSIDAEAPQPDNSLDRLAPSGASEEASTSNENGEGWTQVEPEDGPLGGKWSFDGGRSMKFEVQSVNVIGAAGYTGWYNVYAIDKSGKTVPEVRSYDQPKWWEFWKPRPTLVTPLGNHVLPMLTDDQTIEAPFDSPSGRYRWTVKLQETNQPTANNTSPFFFRVFTSGQ